MLKYFGKAHKKSKFLAILEGVFFKKILACRRQPWRLLPIPKLSFWVACEWRATSELVVRCLEGFAYLYSLQVFFTVNAGALSQKLYVGC